MKSSDRNDDSMAGTVARRRRRDPRRSPGLFFVHVLLILLLLAARTAAAGRPAVERRTPRAVALPGGHRRGAVDARPTLGPLSGPPSRPVNLEADLKAKGYEMPEDANVYAVRIMEGPEGRIYEQFEAGGGALADDFWPASSIKVLAALGALDFARSLGFTGAATVAFDDGLPSQTLRSIYEPAIRDSSNYDYDLLVRIAGLDRLNAEFLTARNGFPVTSISRSYGGPGLRRVAGHGPGGGRPAGVRARAQGRAGPGVRGGTARTCSRWPSRSGASSSTTRSRPSSGSTSTRSTSRPSPAPCKRPRASSRPP